MEASEASGTHVVPQIKFTAEATVIKAADIAKQEEESK